MDEKPKIPVEEKLDLIAGALGVLCAAVGQTLAAVDPLSGALCMRAYADCVAAIEGRAAGKEAYDALVKSLTGLSMPDVRDLKKAGLTTEQALDVLKKEKDNYGD